MRVVLSLGAVALVSRRRLRAGAGGAGAQPRRALSLRGAAGRRALGTSVRGARVDREHARLQLVLPSADAHLSVAGLGELGRARRVPRDGRERQRARDTAAAARARGRGEDRRAPVRQSRPALADHGDPHGERGRARRRLRGRAGRVARFDSPPGAPPRPARREPARPVAARGGGRARRTSRSGRSTVSSHARSTRSVPRETRSTSCFPPSRRRSRSMRRRWSACS